MLRRSLFALPLALVACSDSNSTGGQDLSAAPDLAAGVDLSVAADLSAGPDLGAGPDLAPSPDLAIPPNVVFVTSTTLVGKELVTGPDMGSPTALAVAKADGICAARAAAAGLPGTYRAWLGGGSMSPASRLGAARGWVRTDGRPVVDTVADLLASRFLYPVAVNESGVKVEAGERVLTGLLADGTDGQTCAGWTSTTGAEAYSVGVVGSGGSSWVDLYQDPCDSNSALAARLYCFGVDRTATLAKPATPTGRLIFLTKGTVTGDGGIAAMDALCTQEATAAGIGAPRTYKALISTETTSGASRFTNAAGPIFRTDGVEVALTATALFEAGKDLLAPLNVAADKSVITDGNGPFTGSTSMDVANGVACMGWVGMGPGAIAGNAERSDSGRYSATTTACSDTRPVYCLQQ